MRKTIPVLLLLAAAPLAHAAISPPNVPRVLVPPPQEEAAFALDVSGVQVYQCSAVGLGGYGWAYTAPDAMLYEDSREVARTTSPGLWESLRDRSSLTAIPRTSVPAGAGNLPWMLMRAAPLGETGMFAGVTSLLRIDTAGGAAPGAGCTDDRVGQEVRVPFTARYVFYRPAGR